MKKLILFFSFLAFTAVAQAQVTSLAENFNTCDTTDVNGAHPSGWTTYNAVGSQKWFWTYTFGVTYGTGGIQVNGYQGGNNANEDWLITPKLDLSSYSTIYLHFYARFKFAGAPLQVLYSTDYTGTGNPNSATWTAVTMNRPFAAGDTVWNMFSANMTSVKSTPLFVAFKYTSTTSDGSRWTIDSVFTSSTSGINNVSIENTPVSIIGQATANHINVSFTSLTSEEYAINVTDITGRTVFTKTVNAEEGTNQFTLSNLNLTAGMYLVEVRNAKSYGVAKAMVN